MAMQVVWRRSEEDLARVQGEVELDLEPDFYECSTEEHSKFVDNNLTTGRRMIMCRVFSNEEVSLGQPADKPGVQSVNSLS